MTTLRSSDYEAGWRLRLTFGDGEDASGVLDDEATVRGGGQWYDLSWRLGEGRTQPDTERRITDITVLDRPSPFEMGAKVRTPACGEDTCKRLSHEVTGWDPATAMVELDYGRYERAPHELTLAPEPPQVEVGSWWERSNGGVYVVVATEELCVRRIDLRGTSPVALKELRDGFHWTRLDGPPEPAIGDVYEIAGVVWQNVGNNGSRRPYLHQRIGQEVARFWSQGTDAMTAIHAPADLATLRIIGNVGGEG